MYVCRCVFSSPGVKEIAVLVLKSQVICCEQSSHLGGQRALFGFVYRSVYIVSVLQTFKRDDGFLQTNHCVQMAKSFCRYC